MDTSEDKSDISDKIADKDTHDKVEKLLAQIMELENEKQKSHEQFSAQRGQLKKLFLQKEEESQKLQSELKKLRAELDEARTQMTVSSLDLEAKETERLKSQDELASLQQFVNSTLEESSRYELEIQLLKSQNEHLITELQSWKSMQQSQGLQHGHHSQQQQPALQTAAGESVLVHPGQMLSSLARKVAQLGTSDSQQPNQALVDNLEESMRKAKEESEVLKSLLDPLEEEIKSLKDKLRETDEQLQRYRAREEKVLAERAILRAQDANRELANCPGSEQEADSSLKNDVCDMCLNYEEQLVQSQKKVSELEKQLVNVERYKEQLAKETVFRKEMEEKFSESKEEHKNQVINLQTKYERNEKIITELKQSFTKFRDEILRRFAALSEDRRKTEEKLEQIVHENETLVGKFIPSAQSLQNEDINLPDRVESLQEMWLSQRDDLIKARLGMEKQEDIIQNLECISSHLETKKEELEQHIVNLRKELANKDKALQEKNNMCSEIENLKMQVETLSAEKRKLEDSKTELHNRLLSLQTGLENGEAVQKDFVLLSQSLQKELERLREQHKELRWEHEDDVLECRGCEQSFKTPSKKKMNCKHCGRIFCLACLQHKITSGPNQRESRVCQTPPQIRSVCRTVIPSALSS
ncbi:Rabaptin-like protein [Nesidiocoris tenuis]|uniref:Rabaptin-like protein n=1 Tax=Nesidiocoris tenuis TaxID=355587 RepID=A0ABN7AVA2_9HEMI|nr:Rabaptin-like protein [Nesidiocoris tenuis]